jgi:hypothetical protein
MPEPTQQTDVNELERLRLANAQLTEKSKNRKLKIAELEAVNAAIQAQLRLITVDAPMRSMAESMSTVPDLFIEQFQKSHRLEMIEGKLTIVNAEDGKPINVAFEREALLKHLIDEKNPQAKTFNAILIASRASGGAAPTTQRAAKPVTIQKRFGLR